MNWASESTRFLTHQMNSTKQLMKETFSNHRFPNQLNWMNLQHPLEKPEVIENEKRMERRIRRSKNPNVRYRALIRFHHRTRIDPLLLLTAMTLDKGHGW